MKKTVCLTDQQGKNTFFPSFADVQVIVPEPGICWKKQFPAKQMSSKLDHGWNSTYPLAKI